jgi:hypothetical protein
MRSARRGVGKKRRSLQDRVDWVHDLVDPLDCVRSGQLVPELPIDGPAGVDPGVGLHLLYFIECGSR